MNPQEYVRMHALERDYWWFAGRRSIIAGLLKTVLAQPDSAGDSGPRLLDIGCGTGANLPMLIDLVGRGSVTGLDYSPLALGFAREVGGAQRLRLLQGDALRLPFGTASFDVVTMFDVLEHLRDDHLALSEVWRVLRRSGALVWSVPAYKHLWSAHDEALHHFRRYEMIELRRVLRQSGFEIRRLSFAMSLMPPFIWLWRRFVLSGAAASRSQNGSSAPSPVASHAAAEDLPGNGQRHGAKLPTVPAWLNRGLIGYLNAESRLIARRPLRFGTSLVGIAVKK